MDNVTIFFFPYAGASASVYGKWRPLFHEAINLVPIELPGRGRRFLEPLRTNIPDLVEDIFRTISDQLIAQPYAFFGHSLGSIIAFELSRKAMDYKINLPIHLFVSGRASPSIKESEEMVYLLPNEQFKQKLRSLGGTPLEFFQNEQLMSVFLPILKADYEASDTYQFIETTEKLPCDITVFHGMQDVPCDPSLWGMHTDGVCHVHKFEGGHFFINEHVKPITEIINSVLHKKEGYSR